VSVDCGQLSGEFITANDNCSSSVQIQYSDVISGFGCSYTLTRTYNAQDACGNSTEFVQLIHVEDTQSPVFVNVPSNVTTSCTIPSTAISPGVIDNCSDAITPVLTETITGEGCDLQIVRLWTATDNCGNSATASQTITVSDNVAPVLIGVPQNVTLSCGLVPSAPIVTATDNCTALVTVSFNESQSGAGCNLHIVRTWTAIDDCGNASSASQVIFISDAVAPVWSSVPSDLNLGCSGQLPVIASPTATDDCDFDLTIQFVEYAESTPCGEIVHRVWTAIDDCGNSSSIDQSISFQDFDAPVIQVNAPEIINTDCGNIPAVPSVIALDDCTSANLFYYEEVMNEGCPYTMMRTWIAIDACGNQSQWTQSIFISDSEAPIFVDVPLDMVIECGDRLPVVDPIAFDNCTNELSVTMIENSSMVGCTEVITRTWTATDLCGNAAVVSQTITQIDNSIPEFSVLPQNMIVTCENIPLVPEVTAFDLCQGEVDVIFTESTNSISNASATCNLLTPDSPFGDVVLWLPGLNGVTSDYVFNSQGGFLVQNNVDGTATVTGQVVNVDEPQQGWIVSLIMGNRQNWADWSAQGRSYKDDYGYAGNHFVNWDYYELDPASSLVGTGSLSGSQLQLTHAPSTYYFGFQVGDGANNTNASYGISGWFYYSGIVNGGTVSGHGDFFADNACCSIQNIVRTWTAIDCSGNSIEHSQVITVGQLRSTL
jgi:hypothetical protein